jgi:hypothetical protein
MTQIMNLLHLAPDIQEQILYLPPLQGLNERNLRSVDASGTGPQYHITRKIYFVACTSIDIATIVAAAGEAGRIAKVTAILTMSIKPVNRISPHICIPIPAPWIARLRASAIRVRSHEPTHPGLFVSLIGVVEAGGPHPGSVKAFR